MADDKLKSSLEIAMERLHKKDADAGVTMQRLTDDQKAAIAEVRNLYESKLAQEDVLHQSKMRGSIDPAERETAEQQFRRERERLTTERDAKIEKIRRGAD